MFAWICLMAVFSPVIFYGVTRHLRKKLATYRYASKEGIRFDFVGMSVLCHIIAAFVSVALIASPGIVLSIVAIVGSIFGCIYGMWRWSDRLFKDAE